LIEMRSDTNTARETPMADAPAVDYFALLGLPARYAIDRDELERRYLERSRKTHPDRFVGAAARDRARALGDSMELNRAVKTLRDDVRRAEHLLAHYGVTIGGNEQLDPGFLMAILEAREELAEAQERGDLAEVSRLEDQMHERRDASLARVAEGFADIEASAADREERLAAIKRALIVLRYIDRYLEATVEDD
jgi:molecular chaperone HscB